jgi:hypothetical protein
MKESDRLETYAFYESKVSYFFKIPWTYKLFQAGTSGKSTDTYVSYRIRQLYMQQKAALQEESIISAG